MIEQIFKKRLSKYLNIELDLVINENRCTMLNLLEKKRDWARLSVHKMFLDAPDPVISAIAHYVRGTRKDKQSQNLVLRGFIQQNLPRFDYSHLLDKKKLASIGKIYDLKEIYHQVNKTYFANQLDLKITWYGQTGRRNRSRVTFGQYHDALRLVKIHRMLDDPFFPYFFVCFVVYHEMLHHVVPGFVDEKGFYCTHGEEFKQKERQFRHYEAAIEWEKKHRQYFFK